MNTYNLTLDIPCENKHIDVEALKRELLAFAKILVSSPSLTLPQTTESTLDPFAELDTAWGGDRDANEISEELHSMRSDSRVAEKW